jgi:hypothetical protein
MWWRRRLCVFNTTISDIYAGSHSVFKSDAPPSTQSKCHPKSDSDTCRRTDAEPNAYADTCTISDTNPVC